MKYKEILPGEKLRPYVKCYFMFESETAVELEDTVFPGGFMEIMFNLGEGIWKSSANNKFHTTPPIELWGQLTKPLAIQAKGKNTMLGIRFFPHSAAYFLKEEVWEFNDQIADLRDLLGASARTLHARLMDARDPGTRVALIENFLWNRLSLAEKRARKIQMVGRISAELNNNGSVENMKALASQYGITSRYLQKLFLQCTGVTPKLYSKINRFQHSLRLINKKDVPLTTVAYDCGYFDQSHFIRDFKSFTGITPSAYSPELFPVSQVFNNS
jgi:AraC-like DNA-binding protein